MIRAMDPVTRPSRKPGAPCKPDCGAKETDRSSKPAPQPSSQKAMPPQRTVSTPPPTHHAENRAQPIADKTAHAIRDTSKEKRQDDEKGEVITERRRQQNPGDLLIMSLNVNGLRQKRKVTAPGGYLSPLKKQPEICILVETHLTEAEADHFQLSTYWKAHAHCSQPEDGQMEGRVLIMVKQRVTFTKDDELPGANLPLHSCSIWLYLNNPELPVVRLTGVYFSPATKPRVAQVEMLTDER